LIILGADTSLPILSVALLRDDEVVGAIALEGKGSRNEKLLPALDWLLAESNIARETIDLFAVTRGPGSFTGVRIGLATIQGLALALGKPVCAMSTHEAIALGSGESDAVVVDDAGRGELYVSEFRGGCEAVPPHLGAMAPPRAIVASEFVQRSNVAVACARRAAQIASEGSLDRHADVTPIYVRLAEADVKLQQKRNG
jgi:tRNA threonylcarbamoyladenosine biosynthesis protein TsaB